MRSIPRFHDHLRAALRVLVAWKGPAALSAVVDVLLRETALLTHHEAVFVARLAIEVERVRRKRKLAEHEISPAAVIVAARSRIEGRRRKDRLEVRARVSVLAATASAVGGF